MKCNVYTHVVLNLSSVYSIQIRVHHTYITDVIHFQSVVLLVAIGVFP